MSSSWPTVAPALNVGFAKSSLNGGALGSARVLGHRGLYYPAGRQSTQLSDTVDSVASSYSQAPHPPHLFLNP